MSEGFVGFTHYLRYFKAAWGNYWSIVVLLGVSIVFQMIYMAVPYWTLILVESD